MKLHSIIMANDMMKHQRGLVIRIVTDAGVQVSRAEVEYGHDEFSDETQNPAWLVRDLKAKINR